MRATSFFFMGSVGLAASLLALGACSSKDTASTTGTSSSSSSGASSSSSSGAGGSTSSSSSSSSSGAPCPTCVNACDPAKATDLTAMGAVTIKFGTPGPGFAYDPPCIKIKAGTMVTWEGDFGLHPLEPGTVDAGVVTPDPSSPIKATTAGMSATFALTPAGTYGFYCGLHQFAGAAFVQ